MLFLLFLFVLLLLILTLFGLLNGRKWFSRSKGRRIEFEGLAIAVFFLFFVQLLE